MNDNTNATGPIDDRASWPFTVDLVWWKGRLWFTVATEDHSVVRTMELTGGGATEVHWKGESNA